MRKFATPQTVIPSASRRINPDTLMPELDNRDRPLWNMPAPVRHAEHKRGQGHVMVPIYRGTSASYARWVKAQLRRRQRKTAEAKGEHDAKHD